MSRPHVDHDDHKLHLRLVNWGYWARWRPDLGHHRQPHNRPDPDELDAQEMEKAMLALKHSRKKLYRPLFLRYVAGKDDVLAAPRLRCSVTTFKERCRRAFSWLHGYFDRESKG